MLLPLENMMNILSHLFQSLNKFEPSNDLHHISSHKRFTAGQPDLFYSLPHEDSGKLDDFIGRQNVVLRAQGHSIKL